MALDWNDDTPTAALTRRSFALHQQLADRFGADAIHYRRVSCLSAQIADPDKQTKTTTTKKRKKKRSALAAEVEWATRRRMTENSVMGQEDTVAQVHPKLLCEHLWEVCESKGCTLVKGKVTGAVANAQGKLEAVALTNEESGTSSQIPTDALLYACGPWTANVMYGIKVHSIVLPTRRILKQCVFFTSEDFGDCEVFVRPDTTAFCSGLMEDGMVKVQEFPGQEQVEPALSQRLREAVRKCSGVMGAWQSLDAAAAADDRKQDAAIVLGEPIMENACYQPVTDDYLPIIGPLTKRASGCDGGCYMAGGNNCWGILLGPATGECMADLIVTGKTEHVDIAKFRPSRYRNLKAVED